MGPSIPPDQLDAPEGMGWVIRKNLFLRHKRRSLGGFGLLFLLLPSFGIVRACQDTANGHR